MVLATANPDKVVELEELLGDRFEVQPRPADLAETIEDEDSLEGNAIKKATEVAQATGAWALADDTGLFVDALDGGPGVHTARYAGPEATYEQNVDLLLASLADVEPDDRTATFRTVVALIGPDGAGLTAEGAVDGYIAAQSGSARVGSGTTRCSSRSRAVVARSARCRERKNTSCPTAAEPWPPSTPPSPNPPSRCSPHVQSSPEVQTSGSSPPFSGAGASGSANRAVRGRTGGYDPRFCGA